MKLLHVLNRMRYLTHVAWRQALRMRSHLSRAAGKRILIVFDPSLIAFNGHHMEFARMIKEGCGGTFDLRFYANVCTATRILLSLPAQPICNHGIYPPHGNFDDVYRTMTESTISALNRIDRRDLHPDTILLIHTVTLYQLGGLAEWFAALPSSARPKLCLQFQFPLEFLLSEDRTVRARAIYLARVAAKLLFMTGETRLASNSRLLADHISRELEQTCALLPIPIQWPDTNQSIAPEPGVVFGFFGALRTEKGASVISEAIPEFAARYPETRFLIQAPRWESHSSAISALETVPQVELFRSNFSRKDDYFKQFARASCILLPYDPIVYAYRTSGILIEALGLDRLIVTTEGSWLYAEAKRRGGNVIAMKSFTPSALVSSLIAARDLICSQPIKPKMNLEITTENSANAFCAALTQLADAKQRNEGSS